MGRAATKRRRQEGHTRSAHASARQSALRPLRPRPSRGWRYCDNRDMQATTHKNLHPNEKLTALAGIAKARRNNNIGIRPTAAPQRPIRIPEQATDDSSKAQAAMYLAGEAWPDQNQWDLMGWDGTPDEWEGADCYATFNSFDEADDDGFSNGA